MSSESTNRDPHTSQGYGRGRRHGPGSGSGHGNGRGRGSYQNNRNSRDSRESGGRGGSRGNGRDSGNFRGSRGRGNNSNYQSGQSLRNNNSSPTAGSPDRSNYRDRKRRATYQPVDVLATSHDIPKTLDVVDFASARAQELSILIGMMKASSKDPTANVETTSAQTGGGRRAFQSLPRHMRRRAMSHNVHRLPYRLRAKAQREMEKSNTQAIGKSARTKSLRRYRRRPRMLQSSHALGMHDFQWLETHIWHAKRMRMAKLWGYKLSSVPTAKSFRSTYKAHMHLSTVYDASYISCIRIKSTHSKIRQLFSSLLNSSSPLFHRVYLDGSRTGKIMLYKPNQFPYGFIAPIEFQWRSSSKNPQSIPNDSTEVWIWVHAAVFEEVLSLLHDENLRHQCSCEIISLKGDLCRFELTGSMCQHVLRAVLQCPEVISNAFSPAMSGNEMWSLLGTAGLRHPASLPPNVVIGLSVKHPATLQKRGGMHQPFVVNGKRTYLKSTPLPITKPDQSKLIDVITNWPISVANSSLWDQAVRETQTGSTSLGKRKAEFVNHLQSRLPSEVQMKTEKLQPSKGTKASRSRFVDELDKNVEIFLVQRPCPSQSISNSSPHDEQRGIGAGWDLIVSAGYGKAFWKALVYAGARAIGIQDRRRFKFEAGADTFPEDYPDSLAGNMYEQFVGENARISWLRHPPDRRVNYHKFAIQAPFQPNWNSLFAEPSDRFADIPYPHLSFDALRLMNPRLEMMKSVLSSKCNGSSKEENSSQSKEPIPSQPVHINQSYLSLIRKFPFSVQQSPVQHDLEVIEANLETGLENLENGAELPATKRQKRTHAKPEVLASNDKSPVESSKESILPYFVLRNWRIAAAINNSNHTKAFRDCIDQFSAQENVRALLSVQLQLCHRGLPTPNAIICLPLPEDVDAICKSLKRTKNYLKYSEWIGVDEPIHRISQQVSADKLPVDCASSNSADKSISNVCVIPSPTRTVIGYVTNGMFSYARGQGTGIGYIAASKFGQAYELSKSWVSTIGKETCIVLIRNVSSRSYRPSFMILR